MKNIDEVKIGCIGCGTMGGAVVKAIAGKFKPENIFVTAGHYEKAVEFAKETSCQALDSNLDLAKKSDIIFIAVKPAYVKSVLEELKTAFTSEGSEQGGKIIVSMAAGLSISRLKEYCGIEGLSAPCKEFVSPHFMRIMPNLPAVYGQSMTALCLDSSVSEDECKLVKSLLESAGQVEVLSEKLMDGVTAVSGSGPAYAFMFIEALADAAVRFGIPRKQAYIYAAQTLKGAAVMALEDSRSISELKDAVCSPAGTTIEGVACLERRNFRGTVIEAASAAFNKSVELGKKS